MDLPLQYFTHLGSSLSLDCIYVHRWTLLHWNLQHAGFLRTVLGYDSLGQSIFNTLSYSSFVVLF